MDGYGISEIAFAVLYGVVPKLVQPFLVAAVDHGADHKWRLIGKVGIGST